MNEKRCIFIILPDVTNNFKDKCVIEKLEEKEFIILKKKKIYLTGNDILEIFTYKPEQYEHIEEFYEYLESGLCVVCLIEHLEGDTIKKLNLLIKSTSMFIKDEKYFDCLEYQCNLRCKNIPFYFSKNCWYFCRDLNYFFPPHNKNNIERSLIILKPDAIENNKINDIINDILNFNLLVVAIKRGVLSNERASKLYEDLKHKPYYHTLIDFMTSKVGIVCLLIEGINCIDRVKILCGPSLSLVSFKDMPKRCLKKKYGTSEMRNAVHVPSDEKIDYEIELFFREEDMNSEIGILLIKKSIVNPDALFQLRDYFNMYGFKILEEKVINMDNSMLMYLISENKSKINEQINEQVCRTLKGNIEKFVIILVHRINCLTCLEYLIDLKSVREYKIKSPNCILSMFMCCSYQLGNRHIDIPNGSKQNYKNIGNDYYYNSNENNVSNKNIIFVKDKDKIIELIKRYFNFAKYNDTLTVDMIRDFFFCKNVKTFEKKEKNIKLNDVLLECFTEICKKKTR
uniref:nucleoside-diphosphate kinase n=1 Tax=Piliocolobus tephrosceles TaxID=591936 RepID=A0A8C9LHC5_9PRIM